MTTLTFSRNALLASNITYAAKMLAFCAMGSVTTEDYAVEVKARIACANASRELYQVAMFPTEYLFDWAYDLALAAFRSAIDAGGSLFDGSNKAITKLRETRDELA